MLCGCRVAATVATTFLVFCQAVANRKEWKTDNSRKLLICPRNFGKGETNWLYWSVRYGNWKLVKIGGDMTHVMMRYDVADTPLVMCRNKQHFGMSNATADIYIFNPLSRSLHVDFKLVLSQRIRDESFSSLKCSAKVNRYTYDPKATRQILELMKRQKLIGDVIEKLTSYDRIFVCRMRHPLTNEMIYSNKINIKAPKLHLTTVNRAQSSHVRAGGVLSLGCISETEHTSGSIQLYQGGQKVQEVRRYAKHVHEPLRRTDHLVVEYLLKISSQQQSGNYSCSVGSHGHRVSSNPVTVFVL